MCGILGVTGGRVSHDEFRRALGLIEHRGPDDEGVYEDGDLSVIFTDPLRTAGPRGSAKTMIAGLDAREALRDHKTSGFTSRRMQASWAPIARVSR